MTKNGREDSGRYGIILGSEVVLKVDPEAAAAHEVGPDSPVPRHTPGIGSSGETGEGGLSKALSQYLDSGKTATVQSSASDAVTAKVAPTSGATGMAEPTTANEAGPKPTDS